MTVCVSIVIAKTFGLPVLSTFTHSLCDNKNYKNIQCNLIINKITQNNFFFILQVLFTKRQLHL